jgi:biopolymer transport protein ExbB/TolQ
MELDLVEIWHSMNNLVRTVVIVLTIQAVGCISVAIDRLILLYVSGKKSRAFAAEAGKAMASADYESVLAIAKKHEGSHLATFVETGVGTFTRRVSEGQSREKAAELASRALERKGEKLSESLNKGMNVLASTGSTAPFIGLLGTVLGILNAFKLIAEEGSGGMGTIGSAIGEALIVTGYGLMVAIPAVLVFNWLSGRIARYESGLANSGSELLDQIEAGTSERAREESPRPAMGAAIPSPA